MKTIKASILILAVIALSGCKYKTMSEQLTIEKQNLTSQLSRSDSTLKAYQAFMREAEAKLSALVGGEETAGQQVADEDLQARFEKDITDITVSLQETQQKYQAARGRYASATSKIKALEDEVGQLKALVDKKDSLINVLNDKTAALAANIEEQAAKIDEMKGINSDLENKIDEITGSLNTAWYATGTVADLTAKNIIAKTGGFLGFLGRVKVLSPSVSSSSLEKIDIREKTIFELNCAPDKVRLITHHAAGSYQLITGDSETVTLKVNDPGKFWECSRYLVITW
jgi:multidrug efflux pump subunit AcrA (membrane-fusion protein)